MMFHPMHVHGHTFALRDGGARKDTVIVRPMQALEVDLDADNPGQWATPLPQHLPRRDGHDDDPVLPGLRSKQVLSKGLT